MRIGQLSVSSGVSVRSLRYYEEQGLLEPRRTSGGQRVYSAAHLVTVSRIQDLYAAGFCSSVIRELLPTLAAPTPDADVLAAAFDAAAERLESERRAIDDELSALGELRRLAGLDPHTHVSMQGGGHDSSPAAPPTPPDHRDRRLR